MTAMQSTFLDLGNGIYLHLEASSCACCHDKTDEMASFIASSRFNPALAAAAANSEMYHTSQSCADLTSYLTSVDHQLESCNLNTFIYSYQHKMKLLPGNKTELRLSSNEGIIKTTCPLKFPLKTHVVPCRRRIINNGMEEFEEFREIDLNLLAQAAKNLYDDMKKINARGSSLIITVPSIVRPLTMVNGVAVPAINSSSFDSSPHESYFFTTHLTIAVACINVFCHELAMTQCSAASSGWDRISSPSIVNGNPRINGSQIRVDKSSASDLFVSINKIAPHVQRMCNQELHDWLFRNI